MKCGECNYDDDGLCDKYGFYPVEDEDHCRGQKGVKEEGYSFVTEDGKTLNEIDEIDDHSRYDYEEETMHIKLDDVKFDNLVIRQPKRFIFENGNRCYTVYDAMTKHVRRKGK